MMLLRESQRTHQLFASRLLPKRTISRRQLQYANNPYLILDGLSKFNNDYPAQIKLFNSFDNTLHRAFDDTKQWIKGKNNPLVKWKQRSGNKDYPYEQFHCMKGDNFCIVYNINGTIIEFTKLGEDIIISEVGNIAKSDKAVAKSDEVYEFLLKKYSKFQEIIEENED